MFSKKIAIFIDELNVLREEKIAKLTEKHDKKIAKAVKSKDVGKINNLEKDKARDLRVVNGDYDSFIEYLNNVKFEEASPDEIELLQFGMFYDGINTMYYNEKAFLLEQQQFNEVVSNHLFHSYTKAHLTLSVKSFPGETMDRFRSYAGLYMSHFGIAKEEPKYAQSLRNKLYLMYYRDSESIVFAPHHETANYFYNKLVNLGIEGYIELADGLDFRIEPFTSYLESGKMGTMLEITYRQGFITQGQGFRDSRAGAVDAPMIQINGKWMRTTNNSNIAKETSKMKKFVEDLAGV